MIHMQSRKCIIGRSLRMFDEDDLESVQVHNSVSEFSLISNKWYHHKEWIPLKLVGRIGRSVLQSMKIIYFDWNTGMVINKKRVQRC